jgi:hypothetical protein
MSYGIPSHDLLFFFRPFAGWHEDTGPGIFFQPVYIYITRQFPWLIPCFHLPEKKEKRIYQTGPVPQWHPTPVYPV